MSCRVKTPFSFAKMLSQVKPARIGRVHCAQPSVVVVFQILSQLFGSANLPPRDIGALSHTPLWPSA